MEKQIDDILSKLEIHPDFTKWAIATLKSNHALEIEDRKVIQSTLDTTIQKVQSKLDQLTDLLLDSVITRSEYSKKKEELKKEIFSLKDKRNHVDSRSEKWIDLTERVFKFAHYNGLCTSVL